MRIFAGSLVGIVVGILVQSLAAYISGRLFPVRAIDIWDQRQIAEAFATRPVGGLAISMAGYFAGALTGAWAARLISRADYTAWIAAGVIALMALIVAVAYPDPAWAQFGAFGVALLGGLIGRHLPVPKRPIEPGPLGLDEDSA